MKRSELCKMVVNTSRTIHILKDGDAFVVHYASERGREKKGIFTKYDIASARAAELSERLGRKITVETFSV